MTVSARGETFRGRWLVGCDGGRSAVRKAGGFEFVGSDPEFTGYSVQVEMADPHKLRLGPPVHADGHVYLLAARDHRDGRFRRRRFPPNPADHARSRAGGVAPYLRHRRHPDGPAACHDLDGSRLSSDALTAKGRCCCRRCRAHPFPSGRPRPQPRARRRHEPWMETCCDHSWQCASRSARQLFRANGIRWGYRFSTGRARKSRSCGQAGARARSKPSSVISSTRATALHTSPSACGLSLSVTILAAPPAVAAALPISSFGGRSRRTRQEGEGLLLPSQASEVHAPGGGRSPNYHQGAVIASKAKRPRLGVSTAVDLSSVVWAPRLVPSQLAPDFIVRALADASAGASDWESRPK